MHASPSCLAGTGLQGTCWGCPQVSLWQAPTPLPLCPFGIPQGTQCFIQGLKNGEREGGGKGSLRITAWKDDGYFKAGVEGVEKGRAYACAASAALKRA